jgi:hypothetical protein
MKFIRFTQMPYVPDASSVIRSRRVAATVVADPTIKSRTFVAPLKNVITPVLRASDVGLKRDTVLAIPRWTSPDFKGRIFLK